MKNNSKRVIYIGIFLFSLILFVIILFLAKDTFFNPTIELSNNHPRLELYFNNSRVSTLKKSNFFPKNKKIRLIITEEKQPKNFGYQDETFNPVEVFGYSVNEQKDTIEIKIFINDQYINSHNLSNNFVRGQTEMTFYHALLNPTMKNDDTMFTNQVIEILRSEVKENKDFLFNFKYK